MAPRLSALLFYAGITLAAIAGTIGATILAINAVLVALLWRQRRPVGDRARPA